MTCLHWLPYDGDDFSQPEDDPIRMKNGHRALPVHIAIESRRMGLCQKANGDDGMVYEDTLAFATDGEQYAAKLRTAGNFGCTMHERKRP